MPVGPVRVTLLAELNTPPGKETLPLINETTTRQDKPTTESDSAAADKKAALPAATPAVAASHASRAHAAGDSETAAVHQTVKPAEQTTRHREDLAARLQGQIRKALLPHFSYPLLARRRGWEGTVRVGLRVEANGSLTRLHLVGSSHHDSLNRAAIKSLTQVARIPDAGSWLDGRHFDLVLSIEYHLIDS